MDRPRPQLAINGVSDSTDDSQDCVKVCTPCPGVCQSATYVNDLDIETNETAELEVPVDQLEPSLDQSWVRGDTAPSTLSANLHIARARGKNKALERRRQTKPNAREGNEAGQANLAGHLMRVPRSSIEGETGRRIHDLDNDPESSKTLVEVRGGVPKSSAQGVIASTSAGRHFASWPLEPSGAESEGRVTPVAPPAVGHFTDVNCQTRPF